MDVESMLDHTLFVGDTAVVRCTYPEVMVKVTAVVGEERVLAEVLYGESHGTRHGYHRDQLSKRFTLNEVFKQMSDKE